jgi:ATP-dependent DNA helicase RecG
MNLEYINNLLSAGEGISIEFKEAAHSVPRSLYETIVSFANTDGGTILLGVTNDGIISGIPD